MDSLPPYKHLPCPDSSASVAMPAKRVSFLTLVAITFLCGLGTADECLYRCRQDPCMMAKAAGGCLLHPTAECRGNACGGCVPEWYVNGQRVVKCIDDSFNLIHIG